MVLAGTFFLVGAVLMAAAVHTAMLILGRVIMGLGQSMFSPLYLCGCGCGCALCFCLLWVQFWPQQAESDGRLSASRRPVLAPSHAIPPRRLLLLLLLLLASVGIAVQVGPLFLSELAPYHLRGAFNTQFQLFITIGILVAQLINYANQVGGCAPMVVSVAEGGSWWVAVRGSEREGVRGSEPQYFQAGTCS